MILNKITPKRNINAGEVLFCLGGEINLNEQALVVNSSPLAYRSIITAHHVNRRRDNISEAELIASFNKKDDKKLFFIEKFADKFAKNSLSSSNFAIPIFKIQINQSISLPIEELTIDEAPIFYVNFTSKISFSLVGATIENKYISLTQQNNTTEMINRH